MENNEQIDTSSINYLYAQYWKPNFYSYTINNMENFKIIKKDMLINILDSLGCKDYLKIQYLTQRYLPFAYIKESNKIIEYESSDLGNDDILKKINQEFKSNTKPTKTLKSKWNELFNKTHSKLNFNLS